MALKIPEGSESLDRSLKAITETEMLPLAAGVK
jgi:hypothetical protein